MTLPFGVRVIRKSWYLGLTTLAVVFVLLGVLLVYALGQYAEEVSERVILPVSSDDIQDPREVDAASRRAQVSSLAPEQDPSVAGESSVGASLTADAEAAEPLSLELILEKYRTAVGLSEVKGVILHGRYVEDEHDFAMKLMVKSPRLVRKVLTDAGLSMVCSYDGDQASIEIEDPEGQLHQQPLSDELYRQAIILEGAVLSLASDKLPDVLVYQWEADQDYEGLNYWTIRRRVSAQQSMIHLLDPETGLERVRFVTFMHEGQRQQLSLHLSDYRQQGQAHLPFAYTLKLNGKVRGEARIESIQLNPGLMLWMFSAK